MSMIKRKEIMYKDINGNSIEFSNDFTGYEVFKEERKLTEIREYKEGQVIGKIFFRPTTSSIIFSVTYNNYNEDRYNNNKVRMVFFTNNNDNICSGEVLKFSPDDSSIVSREFYNNGKDVTEDLYKYINITEQDKLTHKFTDEEKFNIYMRYGNEFRLYDDYKMDSSYFEKVMELMK